MVLSPGWRPSKCSSCLCVVVLWDVEQPGCREGVNMIDGLKAKPQVMAYGT